MQRLALILFWSAALFALVMASMKQPVAIPGDPGDKVQHILAFVVLAVLAACAYPRTRLPLILVGLSVFGALIEIIQMIPALNRDASWLDWLADTVAAAFVLCLVFLARRLRRRGRLGERFS